MNLRTNDFPQASLVHNNGLTYECVLSCPTSVADCANDFPQVAQV